MQIRNFEEIYSFNTFSIKEEQLKYSIQNAYLKNRKQITLCAHFHLPWRFPSSFHVFPTMCMTVLRREANTRSSSGHAPKSLLGS